MEKYKTKMEKYKTGNKLDNEILISIYRHLCIYGNLPEKMLGAEILYLIHCKIYDEICNHKDLKFKAGAEEPDEKVAERIRELFENAKNECPGVFRAGVFGADEKLLLDDKSIAYVARKLQNYNMFQFCAEIRNQKPDAHLEKNV